MITPEIVIKHVVAQGLAIARESEGLIPRLFEQRDLIVTGVDPGSPLTPNQGSFFAPSRRFLQFMREHKRIAVNLNYPKVNMKRPLISVVTGTRKEYVDAGRQVFGTVGVECINIPSENAALGYDNEDGTRGIAWAEELGTLMSTKVQVIVETHDDEVTNLMAELVFWILFLAKLRLESDWKIINASFGVSDIHMPPNFSPPDVFSRALTMEAMVLNTVSGRAFEDTEDNAEFWGLLHPCVTSFVVRLMDGTKVLLLDQNRNS